jgi:hypothetical protein
MSGDSSGNFGAGQNNFSGALKRDRQTTKIKKPGKFCLLV